MSVCLFVCQESGGRPFTSGHALTETQSRVPQLSSAEIVSFDATSAVPRGQIVQLTFTSSWGDRQHLGQFTRGQGEDVGNRDSGRDVRAIKTP